MMDLGTVAGTPNSQARVPSVFKRARAKGPDDPPTNVGGFDVSMNDPRRMRSIERVGNLNRKLDC